MKKTFIFLALMGLFTLAAPKIADAANCQTAVMVCPNGTKHIVFYCDQRDWWDWAELLCGVPIS